MSNTQTLSPSTAAPAGVVTLDDKSLKLQRRVVLLLTVGPFLGFIAAGWWLWGRGFSPLDTVLFGALYCVSGLGVTVGFHRLFTHRSFETKPWLKAVLAIAGSLALEGSIISWVADHRRHHAYADKEGDPHSPHLDDGPGVMGVLKGLIHAHVGWLFDRDRTQIERWTPDLQKDPVIRVISRLFPLWAALSLLTPAILGLAITRSWWGALGGFVWGGLARVFLLHHVTWSVNSVCHFFGKRPFETTDYSTNNWPLALISFGESWHNNHHAFPTSAVHGIGRAQFDISAGFITMLEKTGLARHVKRVTDEQVAKLRSRSTSAFSGAQLTGGGVFYDNRNG